MEPRDYILILGIPRIVRYGPLPQHVALYIPKYHPYAYYHVQATQAEMVEVDRCIRMIIEVCLKTVRLVCERQPLPSDERREAALIKLRMLIMKKLAEGDFLKELEAAKSELLEAQRGSQGPRQKAAAGRDASSADKAKAMGHALQDK